MAIERRKFVELPSTTKLLAFSCGSAGRGLVKLRSSVQFRGRLRIVEVNVIGAYLRSNEYFCRARLHPNEVRTECRSPRTRKAFQSGDSGAMAWRWYYAGGPCVFPACSSRCGARKRAIRSGRTDADADGIRRTPERAPPARRFAVLGRNAPNLMSGSTGFKSRSEMWPFRAAMIELAQPSLLAMHVGRIWDCIGQIIALMTATIGRLRCIATGPERMIGTTRCRSFKRARCCMLHEIFAGMGSPFECFGQPTLDATAVAPIAGFSFRKTPKRCGNSDG